jgi:hypothetical protein
LLPRADGVIMIEWYSACNFERRLTLLGDPIGQHRGGVTFGLMNYSLEPADPG